MKREEIKKLIGESLSKDDDAGESGRKLEEAGVSYEFWR